jgi:1-acyl-sn-glycerol-3-phosphate acyltransferase
VFRYFKEAGLNPLVTEDWKKGIYQLFRVRVIDAPDLDAGNYILCPNHVSDLDALILGLLHPRIRVVAKTAWAANEELMGFCKLHYDIVGVYRDPEIARMTDGEKTAANEHNCKITMDTLKYMKDTGSARHLLIFPQGTISDINKNGLPRIGPGFARIAMSSKARAVNVFLEYPSMEGDTRIVFGAPYAVTDRHHDYRQTWLDGVLALQNRLEDVRTPVFSEKHAHNNSPGDPYF